MRSATTKLYLGILFGHLFLGVNCCVELDFVLGSVNIILFIGGIIFLFYVQKNANIEHFIKVNKKIFDRNFTKEDKEAWIKLYRHPVEEKMEKKER
jgi:hypothetical protein